jgi:heat shock protein HslJ
MKPILFGLLAGSLILMLCFSGCTQQSESPQPQATTPQTAATSMVETSPTGGTGPQQSLAGVTWYLVTFNSGTSGSLNVLPDTEITAFFDGSGIVSGSAGCNRYTASYSVSLNGLFIGSPATTKMNCNSPPGIMTQETYYLTTLQGASTYWIDGDTLTIKNTGGNPILTYSRIRPGSQPSATLSAGNWILLSYIDRGGNIFTPISGTTLTAQFDETGKIGGSSGCNTFSGTYTLPGEGQISIGPLASTLMACEGQGIMSQESMYLSLLQEMDLYSIKGDQLVMSDAGGIATLTFNLQK